jgi:hypothetical protein
VRLGHQTGAHGIAKDDQETQQHHVAEANQIALDGSGSMLAALWGRPVLLVGQIDQPRGQADDEQGRQQKLTDIIPTTPNSIPMKTS